MMNLRTMVIGLESDLIANKLMQNWEHDEGTLQFWRASSNFVYVFEHNQQRYFLRFNTEQERAMEEVTAELNFMEYLKSCGYPCVTSVPSKNGTHIVSEQTTEGKYLAVAFHSVKGQMLDDSMTDLQCEAWGKSLARLHSLSKAYEPVVETRKSWKDVLNYIEEVLTSHPQETEGIDELNSLKKVLEALPISKDTYGLIHYDFQMDNLFYDEDTHTYNVIDFDDAMYSWFALDIVTALDDLLEGEDSFTNLKVESFLNGYQSIMALDNDIIQQYRTFQRFKNLYTFARLIWSLEGSELKEGPSWLENVREKFIRVQENLRRGFFSNVNL